MHLYTKYIVVFEAHLCNKQIFEVSFIDMQTHKESNLFVIDSVDLIS